MPGAGVQTRDILGLERTVGEDRSGRSSERFLPARNQIIGGKIHGLVQGVAVVSDVRCEQWRPGIWRWWAYSPAHKVELMSHAVRGRAGAWVLFDPIPLNQRQVELWCDGGGIDTIVLTNGNHERAAAEWRRVFGCRVAGPTGVPWEMEGIRDVRDVVLDGWKAIRLEGGAPGETAWWLESESLMVFGDAVVNLAGRGLELLPDKYCQDPKLLRRSLQKLLSRPFESALFAHGDPLAKDASARIGGLITG